jgi:alpha-tubulin suppressor-like RCC1 family protein
LKCWGGNLSGQLGLESAGSRGQVNTADMGAALPAVDLGTGRTATQVIAAHEHTCALLDNGQVKCWGEAASGVLGYGNTLDRGSSSNSMGDDLPAVDLGTGRTAVQLAGNQFHMCALLDNGDLKCWGSNLEGQLGYGDVEDRGDEPGEMGDALAPIDLGTGRRAVSVTVGFRSTCALLDNGQVKCWGGNASGQLGQEDNVRRGDQPGEMGDDLAPIDLGTGRTAVAISSGNLHVCALLDNGGTKCWGSGTGLGQGSTSALGNDDGEMGDDLPEIDLGANRSAVAIASGVQYSCALLDDATVKCWGQNIDGQLGYGDVASRGTAANQMGANLPPVQLGTGQTPIAVTTGAAHTCALMVTGRLKCWGRFTALGVGASSEVGDGPAEMGDDLPVVELDGTVGAPRATVVVTAARERVVEGGTITYTIAVTNTGPTTLTGVVITAPDIAACASTIPSVAPGATVTRSCARRATKADIPVISNQVLVTTDQGTASLSNSLNVFVDAAVRRPDGLIRVGSTAFVGDDVVNTTASGQKRTARVRPGKRAVFTVRLQNDGNVADRLTLRAAAGTKAFTVVYRRGSTNVTRAVVAGTFRTPSLAPGARTDLTVVVTPTQRAKKGAALTRPITTTSVTDPTRRDVVSFTVVRR